MRSWFLRVFVVLAVGVAVAVGSAATRQRVELYLRAVGPFDPTLEAPRVARGLRHDAVIPVEGQGHWIVQFRGPIESVWLQAIGLAGGRVLDYIPDQAFVVRIRNAAVEEVRRLPWVRTVTPYHPAYAISPDLARTPTDPVPITIRTFLPEDLPRVTDTVQRLGGVVESSDALEIGGVVTARVRAAAVPALSRVFGVSWIEPRDRAVLFNDRATGILRVDSVRANVGLYGTNEVVAVYDTGLSTGNLSTLHPDFRGRVLATHHYGNRGSWEDANGHGTHVMGTVLGSGAASGAVPSAQFYPTSGSPPSYTGMAPEALLVVQSNLNSDGSLAAADASPFSSVLEDAYVDGARIHSDSWGFVSDGSYNTVSSAVDAFASMHPDMLICFAAGNAGVDSSPKDGFVDLGSLRAPGTAKNCVTVGAMENDRPTIPWVWGSSYGSPIDTDREANNPSGMAAFSSRGPCADPAGPSGERRIKPDVCAPGTWIASTRTDHAFLQEGFETSNVGSLPSGWTRNTTQWAVTGADAYTGSRCLGCGNVNTSYSFSGTAAAITPVRDFRPSDALLVTYRTRYNLRSGDSARCTGDGWPFTSQPAITGSSGGWVYRAELVPSWGDNGQIVDQVRFELTSSNAAGTGPFYWEVDDVRITPYGGDPPSWYGFETGGSARDERYGLLSGTSMATPAVAGMSALVRQYYREVRNHLAPSAALIKATLVASAVNTAPGQYTSPQEVPAQRPNPVQGWGRVDLRRALAPQTAGFPNSRLLFVEATRGLSTNESDSYQISVVSGTPLKVALVYTAPPAAPATSVALVNNLNLEVRGPPSPAHGNGIAAGDQRNNVETVDLPSTLGTGTYTITVTGADVPRGPQPYALAIYGDVQFAARLSVSPKAARVPEGGKYQFQALFDGVPTRAVTWRVVSGGGSITSSGLYTAPASGSTATVRATYGSLTADAIITFSGSVVVSAHVEIYHDRPVDLSVIQVAAGSDPNNPVWSSANQSGVGGTAAYLTLDFDLNGAPASTLPPSAATPWHLKVVDNNANGRTGQIRVFSILFSGVRFNARDLATDIQDGGTTLAWIDPGGLSVSITAPAAGSTLSGTQTFSASATAATRVEFYVDNRFLASATGSGGSYSILWDTTRETNGPHRIGVAAYDTFGNVAYDSRLVATSNSTTRPDVQSAMGSWSWDPATRTLTGVATFRNVGTVKAFGVVLQRLTLWCTGPTISGEIPISMQPVSGAALPRNLGDLDPGQSVSLSLRVTVPPEVTSIPRWTSAGYYFDAASGGNQYFL